MELTSGMARWSDFPQDTFVYLLDYITFKKNEPFFEKIDKESIPDDNLRKEIQIKYINRYSHDSSLPGCRFIYSLELLWDFINVVNAISIKYLNSKSNVADIGTENSCRITGATVYGLDRFDGIYGKMFLELLSKCKDKTLILNTGKGKIIYRKEDAMNLQVKDETFDLIICLSVIEHIEDDAKAMKEMSRVLKKDGIILLTFPMKLEGSAKVDRFYDKDMVLERLVKPSGLKVYRGIMNYNIQRNTIQKEVFISVHYIYKNEKNSFCNE